MSDNLELHIKEAKRLYRRSLERALQVLLDFKDNHPKTESVVFCSEASAKDMILSEIKQNRASPVRIAFRRGGTSKFHLTLISPFDQDFDYNSSIVISEYHDHQHYAHTKHKDHFESRFVYPSPHPFCGNRIELEFRYDALELSVIRKLYELRMMSAKDGREKLYLDLMIWELERYLCDSTRKPRKQIDPRSILGLGLAWKWLYRSKHRPKPKTKTGDDNDSNWRV